MTDKKAQQTQQEIGKVQIDLNSLSMSQEQKKMNNINAITPSNKVGNNTTDSRNN